MSQNLTLVVFQHLFLLQKKKERKKKKIVRNKIGCQRQPEAIKSKKSTVPFDPDGDIR